MLIRVKVKNIFLGEKLKAIDEEMDLKAGSIPRDPAVNINTYTAAVRKAEEDAERRAKAHFEQWKSLELVTMKMEESKRSKYYVILLLIFCLFQVTVRLLNGFTKLKSPKKCLVLTPIT